MDLELIDVLGSGGMGVVHRARQRSLEREVAVKTLREDADPELADALVREACLSGGLDHPNVVPIHSLGRDGDDRPLLVMKRVEGHAWNDLLADPQHPGWSAKARWSEDPLVRNLEVLLEVCDAVHFAHSRGVLHRDLKPHNVMVGSFGEVYLMDWGLAVRAGEESYSPGGSPPYMAPEMLEGRASEQTDVYLLGSILHELLTGRRRHRGPSRLALFSSIAESKPAAFGPDVPPTLAAACNQATSADPAERFGSVQELRQAVGDYLQHRGSLELAAAAAEALAAGKLAESRFGFGHALREWPENAGAQAGLRECLVRMTELELESGSASAAGRLIDELEERGAPSDLLGSLRTRLQSRRKETERLRKMASDLDLTLGSRTRQRLFLGIACVLFVTVLVFYAATRSGAFTPSTAVIVGLPVFGLTVISTVMWIGRRSLLANVINRRIMFTLLLLPIGILFHRIVATNMELSFEQIVVTDMLLVSVVAAAAAISITRWLFVLCGVTLVGSFTASLLPAHALSVLVVTMALTTATAGYLLVRLGLPGDAAPGDEAVR